MRALKRDFFGRVFLEIFMLRSVRLSLPKIGFLSLACVVFAAGAYADVYKYKDEKGKVLYTDKPQFLPAERISGKAENANIVDLDERNDEENTAQAGRDTARKETQASAAEKKKDTAGKAEICNKAREDYRARMSAQTMFEQGDKGQRRALSEKEIAAARASAKEAMEALCK